MSGAPDEAWGWDRMRDDGHAIASGRQTRASTRKALVTGSMPDVPTWTELGEDTGGRSFPRKPHPQKPACAPARPKASTRRSEAHHWCQLTQGATRRPRNAKPDKTAAPNPKPKKKTRNSGPSETRDGWAIRSSADSKEPDELGAAAPGRVSAKSPVTSPCP